MIKILKNKFPYLILAAIIMANTLPFAVNNTLAAEQPPGGATFTTSNSKTSNSSLTNPLGTTNIFEILKRIIGYLIKIGAPILAIMVIYGGYLILTAGDDPEKVKGGKNTILWATVGYIIIISSWGVIYIIGEVLTGDTSKFIK